MIIGLIIILLLVLALPFFFRFVEHNLEIFLFIMGLAAVIVSNTISGHLFVHILTNPFLYFITIAVFVFGVLFIALKKSIAKIIEKLLNRVPLKLFIFLMVVILGLISSIITAIIAALLLVEILHILPIRRQQKINLNIIACFSIGLGAALTPIGEPLATVVVSRLGADFFFLFREIGLFIVVGILILGVVADFYVRRSNKKLVDDLPDEDCDNDIENTKDCGIRAGKIFLFVFALELLGTGFKPLIDNYVVMLSTDILYWINMLSAVLDNATLAAAEISDKMSPSQIRAILMGLLISGGMLVPGNIPNIISACKLKIKSKSWAKLGVPLGMAMLIVYYIFLFLISPAISK